MSRRSLWFLGAGMLALLAGLCVWLVVSDARAYRFVVRLYEDKHFLKMTLRQWGIWAPLLFIALQALQVVIAPIPGDVTGWLGGFVFGQWLGLVYSTLGLTAGSLFAFWVGRQLGAPIVRRLVSDRIWSHVGFIVEAEGAILCFVVFLLPGIPKDTACYLFGMSPMPFWVFAVISTLGRFPGTWVLSAQGAKVASGQFVELALLTALVVAVTLPLYYYRNRIMSWVQDRT